MELAGFALHWGEMLFHCRAAGNNCGVATAMTDLTRSASCLPFLHRFCLLAEVKMPLTCTKDCTMLLCQQAQVINVINVLLPGDSDLAVIWERLGWS